MLMPSCGSSTMPLKDSYRTWSYAAVQTKRIDASQHQTHVVEGAGVLGDDVELPAQGTCQTVNSHHDVMANGLQKLRP
jgi:hypothetical protein